MELNNVSAENLLATGNYNLVEVTVPVLVNKQTGSVKFVTTDLSNIITDKYVCLTSMYGKPVLRTRDNVNNDPVKKLLEGAKDIFLKEGRESLNKYILQKNVPKDWADLIFSLIGIL